MKRITRITINNFKAYIKSSEINLPNGKNLLIYGENGSGKTSLYKAVRHFFASSVNPALTFETNQFSRIPVGEIEVTFEDYDPSSKKVVEGSSVIYKSASPSTESTNAQPLVMTGFRSSGFLDYSQLLKVYLNKGDRPNLFDLIISLIGNYVATKQGLTSSIRDTLANIDKITSCYHRNDIKYGQFKSIANDLASAFPAIISDLNAELAKFVCGYFANMNLYVTLVNPLVWLDERGRICDTKMKGEVYAEVSHYGCSMSQYNTVLNEARLSAISICLYLASLKLTAQASDIKILYLDDVFIGLDSSNRRPVLELIKNEFTDYQIIISTYDKSWYKLASEILADKSQWEYLELYEGAINVDGKEISSPILITGQSEIEIARKHLYDKMHPDYPAAANYMRKAYEMLLSNYLYRPCILDNHFEQIASYKLTALLERSLSFLDSIPLEVNSGVIKAHLKSLMSILKPMLHPLSHYAPDEPVYKNELVQGEKLYDEIRLSLTSADYKNKIKVIVSKGCPLLFRVVSSNNWQMDLFLEMDDNLVVYEDSTGNKHLSISKLHATKQILTEVPKLPKIFQIDDGKKIFPNFCYQDLEDCYNKTIAFIAKTQYKGAIINPNYQEMFYVYGIDSMATEFAYTKIISLV